MARPNALNFSWSLKPIIFLLNAIGIQLDTSGQMKKNTQLVLIIMSIVILLGNVITNVMGTFFKLVQIYKDIEIRSNEFKKWKDEILGSIGPIVQYFSNLFLASGCHLVIFFNYTFTEKWKTIWVKFEEIQRKMDLEEAFYRKVRKNCYLGLSLLLLVRCSFM